MIEIVEISRRALEGFYPGVEIPAMLCAFGVLEDENLAAVGGLFFIASDSTVLFSDAPEGWIRKHPLVTTKIAKRLLAKADENGLGVISFADENTEKADRYLEYLGFTKNGDRYERFNECNFERS